MRRVGRLYYQAMQLAYWLSYNRTKRILYATLNSQYAFKFISSLYPHLILKSDSIGIKITFPACDR